MSDALDSGLRPARQCLAEHAGRGAADRAAAGGPGACSSGARTAPRSPGWWPPCWCRSSSTACRSRHRARRPPSTAPPTDCSRSAGSSSTPSSSTTSPSRPASSRSSRPRSARLSADRRIQALLIAFSFGAFIEGASGFGTPVAICRGAADGPRLHAALRRRAVADRQHRAGRVRRHRHADPDAGRGHRHPGDDAERDGRTSAAVRLAHRAGLAGGRR